MQTREMSVHSVDKGNRHGKAKAISGFIVALLCTVLLHVCVWSAFSFQF